MAGSDGFRMKAGLPLSRREAGRVLRLAGCWLVLGIAQGVVPGGAPRPASGQEPAGEPPAAQEPRSWVIGGSPHLDLWYHGLAMVGFEGIGPLPLYRRDYGASIAGEKAAAGARPSSLDAGRQRFAREFRGDDTYEFFHFLPLYFTFSNRVAMLDALRTLAAGGNPRDVSDPTARFGASAVALVLRDAEHLALLGEYVEALEDEWTSFYSDFRTRLSTRQSARLQDLQSSWNADFAPRLARYLASESLDRGIVLLSPPLGQEGRIFQGDPLHREDNVVVVKLGSEAELAEGEVAEGELFAAVRELCFPLVRRALETVATTADRFEGERRSSFGAVRCGSLLLSRYAPDKVAGYQRYYAGGSAGESAQVLERRFERSFALPAELVQSLQAAVRSIPG